MTKYALIFSTGILVLTASMTLVMAVVVFLYWLFMGQEPRMQETFPTLVTSTWLFFCVASVFGATCWSLWRQHWSRWPLTGFALVVLAAVFIAFGELLGV